MFLYHYFGLDCFWTWNFGQDFEFILFCLCISPVITVLASFGGYSIDMLCKLIDWSLNDLDDLIEKYSSYLIHVPLIFLSIYLLYVIFVFVY